MKDPVHRYPGDGLGVPGDVLIEASSDAADSRQLCPPVTGPRRGRCLRSGAAIRSSERERPEQGGYSKQKRVRGQPPNKRSADRCAQASYVCTQAAARTRLPEASVLLTETAYAHTPELAARSRSRIGPPARAAAGTCVRARITKRALLSAPCYRKRGAPAGPRPADESEGPPRFITRA